MKQINRIVFFIYLLWVLLVMFFNFRGDITFGHGLGDLYYLIVLFFLTLLAIFFYTRVTKGSYNNTVVVYLFAIYLLIVIVSFYFKLTILRGAEYPWNGKLFL